MDKVHVCEAKQIFGLRGVNLNGSNAPFYFVQHVLHEGMTSSEFEFDLPVV